MLNKIWVAFILVGFIAAVAQLLQGDLDIFSRVLSGLFDTAKTGFDISLGLVGIMSLWLGIMKIGERGGLIELFSRLVAPFFRRVFPDIPAGHPASGSIVMNVSANMLGLDNAATPLGLKAMRELQEINPQKDTASNPMIMFLVLNTAGITLIPTTVIAIRQSIALKQGLVGFNAADIFLPTLLGTFVSFCAGLIAVAIWQRINLFCKPVLAFFAGFAALMAGMYFWLAGMPAEQMAQMIGLLGSGLIVSIIVLFVAVAAWRGIDVYESFVDGAKEGFGVAVQIIPYLIAMLVAISVFRTTGGMDYLIGAIRSLVLALGMNDDFVPGPARRPHENSERQRRPRPHGRRHDDLRCRFLPGQASRHHPGLDRNHLLRPGRLFRQREHHQNPLRPGLRPDRRRRRAGRRHSDRLRLLPLRGLTAGQFPARIAPLPRCTKHASIPGCRSLGGEIGRHAILRG